MDSKLRKHALNLITNVLSSFQHQAATTSRVPANRNWATHRFLGGSSASGCYVEKSTHLSSAGEDAQKCPPSFPSPPHTSPFPRLTLCTVERGRGSADCATLPPSRPPANWWRRPAGRTNRFPTPATCLLLLLLYLLLLLLFLLLYSPQC